MLRLPRQWEAHLEVPSLPGMQSLRRLLANPFRPWARADALRVSAKPDSGSQLRELILNGNQPLTLARAISYPLSAISFRQKDF